MRQFTRKGLITVAAATGVLAVTGGYAHADAGASGTATKSPGVLSGNSVEVPVDVPVNACGNSVDVVGVLNPTTGNSCGNESGGSTQQDSSTGRGDSGSSGASADGAASNSPGVASGNQVQVPIEVPVNVCGNGVTVGGLGNGVTGNDCGNDAAPPSDPGSPEQPGSPEEPAEGEEPALPDTPTDRAIPHQPNEPDTQLTTPQGHEELAATGSSMPIGIGAGAGAGMLLAGAILYRKARAAA